ncbi:hypothetical protein JCM8097_006795 [Rhodosporidiobolus ruineniae]
MLVRLALVGVAAAIGVSASSVATPASALSSVLKRHADLAQAVRLVKRAGALSDEQLQDDASAFETLAAMAQTTTTCTSECDGWVSALTTCSFSENASSYTLASMFSTVSCSCEDSDKIKACASCLSMDAEADQSVELCTYLQSAAPSLSAALASATGLTSTGKNSAAASAGASSASASDADTASTSTASAGVQAAAAGGEESGASKMGAVCGALALAGLAALVAVW